MCFQIPLEINNIILFIPKQIKIKTENQNYAHFMKVKTVLKLL